MNTLVDCVIAKELGVIQSNFEEFKNNSILDWELYIEDPNIAVNGEKPFFSLYSQKENISIDFVSFWIRVNKVLDSKSILIIERDSAPIEVNLFDDDPIYDLGERLRLLINTIDEVEKVFEIENIEKFLNELIFDHYYQAGKNVKRSTEFERYGNRMRMYQAIHRPQNQNKYFQKKLVDYGILEPTYSKLYLDHAHFITGVVCVILGILLLGLNNGVIVSLLVFLGFYLKNLCYVYILKDKWNAKEMFLKNSLLAFRDFDEFKEFLDSKDQVVK